MDSTDQEKELEYLKSTNDIFGDSRYQEVPGTEKLIHTRYFQPIKIVMLVRKDDMFKPEDKQRYKLAIIKKDRSMAFDFETGMAMTAAFRLLINEKRPDLVR